VVLNRVGCDSEPSYLLVLTPIKIQIFLLIISSRVDEVLGSESSISYIILRNIVVLESSVSKLAVVSLSTSIIVSYSGTIYSVTRLESLNII
jgi:hypothetical protein